MSVATNDPIPDTFEYEEIRVECKVTRTLVANVAMGDTWECHAGMYSMDRTSTKNVVSTTKKFITNELSSAMESSLVAGGTFPIKAVDIEGEVSTLSTATTLVSGLEESAFVEDSYETDTEESFREPVTMVIESMDGLEMVVYEEKSYYDDLEVTSNLLTTFKEGWDNLESEEVFTAVLEVPIDLKWFHIETAAGYSLTIPENNADKSKDKSLIVLDRTEEDGQLWRWDGNHLCSKLDGGNSWYISVDQDSGGSKRGAKVIAETKSETKKGQAWDYNGKHITSEKGLYLAVRHDGKGSKVCVWTKTDEEEQDWSMGSEGEFEAKFFGIRLPWFERIQIKPVPRPIVHIRPMPRPIVRVPNITIGIPPKKQPIDDMVVGIEPWLRPGGTGHPPKQPIDDMVVGIEPWQRRGGSGHPPKQPIDDMVVGIEPWQRRGGSGHPPKQPIDDMVVGIEPWQRHGGSRRPPQVHHRIHRM
jgi:hypothetical protein